MDDKAMEDMQKELGKFTRLLSSTNRTIIKNAKNDKMEAEGKVRLKKSMKAYGEETGQAKGKVVEFGDEVDEATDEVDGFGKKLKGTSIAGGLLKKGFDVLKKAVIGSTIAVVKTAIEFGKTDAHVKTLSDAVQHGAEALGPFGKVLGGMVEDVDKNIQMFKGLAQSGANFGGSIENMRNAATTAGMPLVQFQELIQNNTPTLAKLFGTVNQSIPEITSLGRELRRFTTKELAGFGITMDETNEFLGTYAELQRARGTQETMTAQQLLDGTKAYAKQLTTLSRLTGQSVQELDKQMRQDATDGVLQAKLAQMSKEDALKFQATMQLVPEGAREAVKELGLLKSPISGAARGLESLGQGAVKDLINKHMSGQIDDIEFTNQLRALAEKMQKGGDGFANAAMAGGDSMYKATLDIVAAMKGGQVDREDFDKITLESQDNNTTALMNSQSAMEMNTVALQKVGTTMMKQLILDDDSIGSDMLNAFVNDQGKTAEQMADTLIGFVDGLGGKKTEMKPEKESKWYKPWTWGGGKKGADVGEDPLAFQGGTNGFRNFGSGTQATLHGVEAVVPKNDIGQMSKLIAEMAGLPPMNEALAVDAFNTNKRGGGEGGSEEIIVLNSLDNKLAQAIEEMRKVNNNLNTGNMISQNIVKTGINTANKLANMGGSLV